MADRFPFVESPPHPNGAARAPGAAPDYAQRAERSIERLARFQAVTAALSSALTPMEVAEAIMTQGLGALAAATGLVASVDNGSLTVLASVGYQPGIFDRGAPFPSGAPAPLVVPLLDAVRTGHPIWVESRQAWSETYPPLGEIPNSVGNRAWAALPLLARGRVIGALGLGFQSERVLDPGERAFLVTLAAECAHALDRARLFEAERLARGEAQSAQARYQALFDQAVHPFLVTDAQGRYLAANQAALRLLGYSLEELQALQRAGGTIVAAGLEWVRQESDVLIQTGSWAGEVELRRKDGTLVPVEGRVQRVDLPTGAVYVGGWRDITAERDLQRLEQEFLAMVAHELRNPVAAIKALAGLMRRTASFQERTVLTIEEQADQLSRLVDDLLESGQLDAGRLELRPERVDLVPLLRQCIVVVQAVSPNHSIRIQAPPEKLFGSWDSNRLVQVFQNLLRHGISRCPAGGEITVSLKNLGDQVQVAVSDPGPLIPASDLPFLFDRFYRSRCREAAPSPRLGLGLHIARGIVEAHGGRMWAESGPEPRTSILFMLPFDLVPPEISREPTLTTRELEVAMLLAQGKTNGEIAAELVLSSGTVNNYIQKILKKLGFNSRVQIATWVLEHGLHRADR